MVNHVAAVIVIDIPHDDEVSNSWNNWVEKEGAENYDQEVAFPFLQNTHDKHLKVQI